MRIGTRTRTVLLVLLAALAAVPATAAASTGGAAAPTAAPAATSASKAHHRIHPSGIATWFGPGFYGHQTACGQTLTPLVVGVANRTLPCGTLISVTYGGHTLTVPVLDRGPYSHIGADWDLTAGAARALGITETVRIQTRLAGSVPNTPTLGLPAVPPEATLAGGAPAAG